MAGPSSKMFTDVGLHARGRASAAAGLTNTTLEILRLTKMQAGTPSDYTALPRPMTLRDLRLPHAFDWLEAVLCFNYVFGFSWPSLRRANAKAKPFAPSENAERYEWHRDRHYIIR